jgi:hypothetical protein
LDLVSTTAWESVEKNTFAPQMTRLIQLFGLNDEISDNETFGESVSMKTKQNNQIDELDSYEYLVRDAGSFNISSRIFITLYLFILKGTE